VFLLSILFSILNNSTAFYFHDIIALTRLMGTADARSATMMHDSNPTKSREASIEGMKYRALIIR